MAAARDLERQLVCALTFTDNPRRGAGWKFISSKEVLKEFGVSSRVLTHWGRAGALWHPNVKKGSGRRLGGRPRFAKKRAFYLDDLVVIAIVKCLMEARLPILVAGKIVKLLQEFQKPPRMKRPFMDDPAQLMVRRPMILIENLLRTQLFLIDGKGKACGLVDSATLLSCLKEIEWLFVMDLKTLAVDVVQKHWDMAKEEINSQILKTVPREPAKRK